MQHNVPKFHHRDSRTYLGIISWLPAGYDPEKPEPVQVGLGKSALWATAKQGLALAVGYTVRIEAIGEIAATLLVTDVISKTSFTPTVVIVTDEQGA